MSKALHGGSSTVRIAAATAERVRRIADRLGYRRNAAARAVSTGRFGAVGLLLSLAPWRSDLPVATLAGLNQELGERDLHLEVSGLPEELFADRRRLPALLREAHVDGYLVKYDTAIPAAMRAALAELDAPLVWMNSRHRHDCVLPDELQAGRMATEHLLALGHRRIAYLECFPRTVSNHYASAERAAGYAQVMRAAGLAPRVANRRPLPPAERPALVAALLRGRDAPTALIASDDHDGLLALHVAAGLGVAVPRQLSLVVVHGGVADQLGVAPTTVLRPLHEVGRAAVATLVQRIAHPRRRLAPVRLPFTLVDGATCAPLR